MLDISTLFNAFPGYIAQGAIWGIMALGLYISYRLLEFSDLTVDGSFATGAAVTVMLIIMGWPAWAAMIVAVIAGMMAGLITGLLVKLTERSNLNRIFARFLCSFVATLLAFCTLKLGLVQTAEHIIIGNIMTLIPGVGLTVALRDLFSGDNITGLLRTAEALLLTLAIVGGYFLTAAISGGAI